MIYSLPNRRVRTVGDYYIAPNASVIGDVVLGHDASVWFNSVLRGDNATITIGDRCNIQDGSVLHVDEGVPLVLEKNVSIGHMVMLHGCTIQAGSLIGINAVVLNHAIVGKRCLVGANTLISEGKQTPDGSLVLGSPGRVVRSLTEEEMAGVESIADHYVEKSRLYRSSLERDER